MTNSPLQAAPVSPYKHALHIPNNVYIHTKPIIVITIPLTESVLLNMDGICYPSNEPVLMRFFPFYATHNSHTSKRTRILSSEVTQVITQIWQVIIFQHSISSIFSQHPIPIPFPLSQNYSQSHPLTQLFLPSSPTIPSLI